MVVQLPVFAEDRLDVRTPGKAIQTSAESDRITPEPREQLRRLRWKERRSCG